MLEFPVIYLQNISLHSLHLDVVLTDQPPLQQGEETFNSGMDSKAEDHLQWSLLDLWGIFLA